MKVVLDTNILISATLWNGSVAQKILFKLISKDAQVYTSKEIILEYGNVLIRDFKYSKEEVNTIVKIILKFSLIIIPKEHIQIIREDPADDKIIDCAIESKADYIIKYDKHLLKIKEYQNIKIVTLEEFKKIIN